MKILILYIVPGCNKLEVRSNLDLRLGLPGSNDLSPPKQSDKDQYSNLDLSSDLPGSNDPSQPKQSDSSIFKL